MVNECRASVEELEQRLTPARIDLIGSLLSVTGDRTADIVDIRTQGDGTVNVRINDVLRTFQTSQITAASINTFSGDDDVFTNLPVGTTIDLGSGNDRANILHGAGSQTFGRQGRDRIYAIIGGPNLIDGGPGRDVAYANVQGVIAADPADDNPVIFGQAVQPGFTLIDGVVYYVPQAGDNRVLLLEANGQILALSQVNGVNQPLVTFDRGDVTDFASILGSGNDAVVNTVIGLNLTVYGAGGNDTLIAGPAGRVLFKGGGGNDVLDASQAKDSDLSGDPGNDVLSGQVVRTDGLDLVSLTKRGRLIRAA